MDKKAMEIMGSDLVSAVSKVLAQHGVPLAAVMGSVASDEITLKIIMPPTSAASGPTKNAVARYKEQAAALGLPKLGAMLMVAGNEYALLGLSSDGKRIKARKNEPSAPLVDLQLKDVQSAIATAGAKQVAALDAAEAAEPADVIDPEVAAVLAALGKKGPTPK